MPTTIIGKPTRQGLDQVVVGVTSGTIPGFQPFRLPWSATVRAGALQEGWLAGPLVDVYAQFHRRVPAELVREIEVAVRQATGGDNLPRVEEAAPPPPNVISIHQRREDLLSQQVRAGATNPPDRRTPHGD